MAVILAGGTLSRLPHPHSAGALGFFEYAPKSPLPTFATLARYAKQLPEQAQCALVCPRSAWVTSKGPMRPCPELDRGLDWVTRCADILRVQAIVLPTGAELTTGDRDRALLAAFVERLQASGRLVVVAPRGLWEAEHGAEFAEQTSAVYGFDPLEDEAPAGAVVYGRVRPMGARPRLTDGHMAQIAERLLAAECERAYVTFESEQATRDARRLTRALAELGAETADAFAESDDELEDEPDDLEDAGTDD